MRTRNCANFFVCARCRHAQQRRLYSDRIAPPPPPRSGAAQLTNRRLISLHGRDAPKFLQGLITNNVRPDSTVGFFAAFLTAQGKVLHDVFIYPTSGSHWHLSQDGDDDAGFLVEVDAEQSDTLLRHLKRHKLRSKFKLRLLESGELDVWSLWREGQRWTAHGQADHHHMLPGVIALTDGRAPGMGQRLLLADTNKAEVLDQVEEAPLEAYTIRRYLRGVAEGQREMPRDDCLPMNCNIDIMGGIDFKKGCYLGQELTIRTHHTGVVRRRILPLMLYDRAATPPNAIQYDEDSERVEPSALDMTDIKRDDHRKRSTGKIIGTIGNLGLGMCRLEQMSDLTISGEGSSFAPDDKFLLCGPDGKEIGVRAFVPDWMRGQIRGPKIQKRVE